MEMSSHKPRSPWRKVLVSAGVGAVVGMAGSFALVRAYEAGTFGELDSSSVVAGVLGALYSLVGLQIGIGLASPGLGAHFLNVEDADELRQQRRVLALAAGSAVATGAALVVLVLGGSGLLTASAALAAALALFAVTVVLAVLQWRHMDELMRNLSTESGNLALYLVLALGGVWSVFAHLGFAPAPAPLDWLTMFYGLVLVAAFIVSGRRGLLKPR